MEGGKFDGTRTTHYPDGIFESFERERLMNAEQWAPPGWIIRGWMFISKNAINDKRVARGNQLFERTRGNYNRAKRRYNVEMTDLSIILEITMLPENPTIRGIYRRRCALTLARPNSWKRGISDFLLFKVIKNVHLCQIPYRLLFTCRRNRTNLLALLNITRITPIYTWNIYVHITGR